MDGLQKLLPWLVSLPFVPKAVLSLVLVLFTGFVLLVLWMPDPSARERPASSSAADDSAGASGAVPAGPYAQIIGPSSVVVGKRAIYRAEFEGNLDFEWHYTQPVKLTDRNIFVELGYVGQTETLTLTVKMPDGRTFSTSKMITAISEH